MLEKTGEKRYSLRRRGGGRGNGVGKHNVIPREYEIPSRVVNIYLK